MALIIPTLNEELFIEDCLNSVYSQTVPQECMEVWVIDGNSSDGTEEIVRKWMQFHPNLHWLNNPKVVQSAAFNLGVANTQSSIVLRMDAHATFDKDYVRLCVDFLQSHPTCGNVGGKWKVIPYNDTSISRSIAQLHTSTFGVGQAAHKKGAMARQVESVSFGAFPREVLNKVGPMNETLRRGEDNEFNARIIKAGYSVWFVPQIQFTYYSRKNTKSLLRQIYANGFSIGRLLSLDPTVVSVRHIVPLFVICTLAVLILCSCFFTWAIWLSAFLAALYLLLDVFFTIEAACHSKQPIALPLIWLFPLTHLTYGLGTFTSLFCKKENHQS